MGSSRRHRYPDPVGKRFNNRFTGKPEHIYLPTISSEVVQAVQETVGSKRRPGTYFINRFASITRPYFPRKLANAMLAAAKVQCGIDLSAQIRLLTQIENELLSGPETGSFDLWMMEMQLLNAYKKTNNVAMQQKYSSRAASGYFI